MKKILVGILTAAFFVGGVVTAQANLINNGDFEEPFSVELDENPNGYTLPAKWKVYDYLPGIWYKGDGTAGIEVQKNGAVPGVNAYSGDYYVELDSHGGNYSNSSMFQEVELEAGVYDLSFWYFARTDYGDDDNGIRGLYGLPTKTQPDYSELLEIGKISETNMALINKWIPVTWTFTVETHGLYAVGFAAFGKDNTLGGFIDAVSLTAAPIPEPSTMLLFGAGLAGLAAVGRRSRREK